MREIKSLKTRNSSEKYCFFLINSVKSFLLDTDFKSEKKMIWQIGLICSTTIQKILQSYALFICFFSYVVKRFQFIQMF